MIGLARGVYVTSAQLSMPAPIEITSFGDNTHHYLPSPDGPTLDLDLYLSDESMEFYNLLLSRLYHPVAHQGLGDGHVCQFCNTTYATGVLVCPQCGGATQWRGKVLPTRTEGILKRLDIDFRRNDYTRLRVEIDLDREPAWVASIPYVSRDWWRELIQYSFFSHPDHWLCAFCGLFVESSLPTCPGCGGNRLPVKELAKLERICIYCGKPTLGGYACPGCGGRLRPRERRI